MALDVYVGPLTRYYARDWQNLVQRAGEARGIPVYVIRTTPDAPDTITDPSVIAPAALAWQRLIAQGLETDVEWEEGPNLPYWTDRPYWDGYGALVLLAAYEVCPDLAPRPKRGFLSRRINPEIPRIFRESPAYRAAADTGGGDYPSLLLGVEWWLPIVGAPRVFRLEDLGGRVRTMSRLDVLHDELRRLNRATMHLDSEQLAAAHGRPPQGPDRPVHELAPFGLSIFMSLVETALANRQPLLLDY
jgi:hypothetical protein